MEEKELLRMMARVGIKVSEERINQVDPETSSSWAESQDILITNSVEEIHDMFAGSYVFYVGGLNDRLTISDKPLPGGWKPKSMRLH